MPIFRGSVRPNINVQRNCSAKIFCCSAEHFLYWGSVHHTSQSSRIRNTSIKKYAMPEHLLLQIALYRQLNLKDLEKNFSSKLVELYLLPLLQLPTIATILGVVGVGSLVYRAQQDYLTGLEAKMTNLETSANDIESSITSLATSISTLSSTVSSLSSSASSESTYVTSICTQVRYLRAQSFTTSLKRHKRWFCI